MTTRPSRRGISHPRSRAAGPPAHPAVAKILEGVIRDLAASRDIPAATAIIARLVKRAQRVCRPVDAAKVGAAARATLRRLGVAAGR